VLKVAPKTAAIDLEVELRGESATVTNWRVELIDGTERIHLSVGTQVQRIGKETFLVAHV
jgi:hypothetical protein